MNREGMERIEMSVLLSRVGVALLLVLWLLSQLPLERPPTVAAPAPPWPGATR